MKKIWSCKIGEVDPDKLPQWPDGAMRNAVAMAYHELTGEDPEFIFSGWGAVLTEPERAVVEDRVPSDLYKQGWDAAMKAVAEEARGTE